MAVTILVLGFLSVSGKRVVQDKTAAWLTASPPNRCLFSSLKTFVDALKNDCANKLSLSFQEPDDSILKYVVEWFLIHYNM